MVPAWSTAVLKIKDFLRRGTGCIDRNIPRKRALENIYTGAGSDAASLETGGGVMRRKYDTQVADRGSGPEKYDGGDENFRSCRGMWKANFAGQKCLMLSRAGRRKHGKMPPLERRSWKNPFGETPRIERRQNYRKCRGNLSKFQLWGQTETRNEAPKI